MTEAQVAEYTKDGQIYHLNDFLDTYMTEKGNYAKSWLPLYRSIRAVSHLRGVGIIPAVPKRHTSNILYSPIPLMRHLQPAQHKNFFEPHN